MSVNVIRDDAWNRLHRYPWSDGTVRREDPTYGRIDRDIQWHVWEMLSEEGAKVSLGQLTAIQLTLQERRNRGGLVADSVPNGPFKHQGRRKGLWARIVEWWRRR